MIGRFDTSGNVQSLSFSNGPVFAGGVNIQGNGRANTGQTLMVTSGAKARCIGNAFGTGLFLFAGGALLTSVDITNTTSSALQIRDNSMIVVSAGLTGSAGNTGFGLDLINARGAVVVLASQPTVTGALGDIRTADSRVLTWAQVMLFGYEDGQGNQITALSNSTGPYRTINESVVGAPVQDFTFNIVGEGEWAFELSGTLLLGLSTLELFANGANLVGCKGAHDLKVVGVTELLFADTTAVIVDTQGLLLAGTATFTVCGCISYRNGQLCSVKSGWYGDDAARAILGYQQCYFSPAGALASLTIHASAAGGILVGTRFTLTKVGN
jgi:hypothetical protein